ncbi:short chain dehydrogenase [Agriterribacter sp.]|uniref:short chain dehydrogenase n=1 Tax=Agriterribacter sp. TaxID=2821509 RepID=UPI002BA770C1|nr:short chain dehydrogenase [Agriterribacter sp.]HRP55004.1 short chain dehydrogenase [Agriterribacter sp.]
MKALVIGSKGTIGKAVTQLLKEKGAEVIEVSRSGDPALDITDNSGMDAFFAKLGAVDVIVSAAGDAAFTALNKVTDNDIQLSVNSKLLGQVNVVRKGVRHLRPGGVVVITGGILAYTPIPQTSLIAMVNAGLEGFARAVALELTEDRRVAVVHPAWVAETASKIGMDPSPWPDAQKTATAYWEAIEGKINGEPVFVKGYEPGKK